MKPDWERISRAASGVVSVCLALAVIVGFLGLIQ